MSELSVRDRALVLQALEGVARWLALLSTWLSEQGAGPELRTSVRVSGTE